MKLSIVATLYQSSAHIAEFYRRASAAAQKLVGNDYEIVLVNDGSPDTSLHMAIEMAESDRHVVVVDLSRNFGHHRAMLAGIEHARGERVFLIDSDLEEEPEWLTTFWERLEQEACDIVFGVQQQRKGGWFERLSGWLFYQIFDVLIGFDFPKNMVTARLMTRRYVDALLLYSEREISIGGLFLITGFDQIEHPVNKHDKSESTYNFSRKMAVLVNSVTSFSNKPLVGIFYVGIVIFAIASIYTCYLVVHWLFLGTPLIGWTSVMASIWLLGGLIISLIGIIGIYLSKIFIETKQRPNYIVRQIYGDSENR